MVLPFDGPAVSFSRPVGFASQPHDWFAFSCACILNLSDWAFYKCDSAHKNGRKTHFFYGGVRCLQKKENTQIITVPYVAHVQVALAFKNDLFLKKSIRF